MTTHLFQPSWILAATAALVLAALAVLLLTQLRVPGEGPAATSLHAPAGGAVTLHQSRATSRITVEGRTAKGESATAVGKPGASVKGKAGKNGKTGSAKGGDGGSASARGGSASAGSVVIQTTTP